MTTALRLCVLISGNGSNLQSIIDAIETGDLQAVIVGVISNNPDAYGLQRAQAHGIQTRVINHRDYGEREQFDQALRQVIDSLQVDLLVLAGFMRILDSDFIQAYQQKIVNIHPSLLPRHKGLNTHQRVLEAGDAEHGISIHLVTAELDDGPVLMQVSFPVNDDDNAQSLQARGHELEHKMYPTLLQMIATGGLEITGDKILFHDQPLLQPLTLDDAPSA